MTRWVPSALGAPFFDFARALEKQFAPIRPVRPVRIPSVAAMSLTAESAARDPYSLAIDETNGKLVMSRPDGAGGYEWVNADGSPL